jgi:hypothetical protein
VQSQKGTHVVIAQEFEARFEDTRFGVLVGNSKHDDSSSIVVIKVDSLRDFASRDRQKLAGKGPQHQTAFAAPKNTYYGTSPVVTCLRIAFSDL